MVDPAHVANNPVNNPAFHTGSSSAERECARYRELRQKDKESELTSFSHDEFHEYTRLTFKYGKLPEIDMSLIP